MSLTFFTDLSPEARIQGSRDPLGILPVWSRLGRTVVSNVTTVSGDLHGWRCLLIMAGLHGDLIDSGRIGAQGTTPLYRAEQLLSISRITCDPDAAGIRGSTRIKALVAKANQGTKAMRLGLDEESKILVNQAAAGVWGQISMPASASKLIDPAQRRLTNESQVVWDQAFKPKLAPYRNRINQILLGQGFEPLKTDRKLAQAFNDLLIGPLAKKEVSLYLAHILHATGVSGQSQSAQAALVQLWRNSAKALRGEMDLVRISALATAADKVNNYELASRLRNIVAAEYLLSPMEQLFSWLQSRHRAPIKQVIADINTKWHKPLDWVEKATDEILRPPVASTYGNDNPFQFFASVRSGLRDGNWAHAVENLIALNAWIMRRRGGDAWIRVSRDQLEVRLANEQAALPLLEDLDQNLIHGYYLDPLLNLLIAWEDGKND